MDENLARLNRIYPNSKYVLIPKYNAELWEDKEYDSAADNKAAINRWKSNPLSYEDAQLKVEEGYRIGWVIPEGYVIIDIDNEDSPESSEKLEQLLNKFEVNYSYNYTSRGMHILLQDSSKTIKTDSRTKCALNIVIDTRANGTGYIILPCNDPHRTWGYWGDSVEEIPYFLKPMCKDNTISFIGMVDGDGRNDALWRWRGRLEQCGKLTNEEIEKSIRIINENLFQIAIPNNELFKTVLRTKEKKKDEPVEKQNILNKYADDLLAQYDIISRGLNFYKFNGIYYEPMSDINLEQLIHQTISTNLSHAQRAEIIEFLKVKTQQDPDLFDKDWYKIACKNGILNLLTGELETPNKTEFNTIFIPIEYDNDPKYSPRIDQFMKEISQGDIIKMNFLYQVAGYCLLKKNMFAKFFIFLGEGGTGKSTYMNLLCKMVGDKNCARVALSDFDKDYYLSGLMSKLVNIDDDVMDNKALEGVGKFKSMISGEPISARQIYKDVVTFKAYCTCVFSCNKLPKIMDKTTGLFRRLVIVELNNKVKTPDPLFLTKVVDEDMQYFLFKAVEGIKQAIEEGHFAINETEGDLLRRFKRRQSALSEWLYENNICTCDLVGNKVLPLYSQFRDWCATNGYNKIPAAYSFKEDICAMYGIELDLIKLENGGLGGQCFTKRGEYDPNFKPF